MDMYDTTKYDTLESIGLNQGALGLMSTEDGYVWKDKNEEIAKYDPTNPDNCYTTWTSGLTYPLHATLCDGVVYQCSDPTMCGVYVPGADDAGETWTVMGGATVPASQTVVYEYYSRTNKYAFGDFAISQTDLAVYKCTNDTND